MPRSPKYFLGALVVFVVGGGATAGLMWRQQRQAEFVRAGVPPVPNVVRWPEEFGRRLRERSEAAVRMRRPQAALEELATLYLANGFEPEARQVLLTLRQLEPDQAPWAYFLAELRWRDGDLEGMEHALEKVVELDPTYVPAWLRLGAAVAKRGEGDAAEECFTRATRVVPGDLRADFALLEFQARRGKRGDLRPEVKRLIEAQPGLRQPHELLAEMQAAAADYAAAARERRAAAAAGRDLARPDPWLDGLAPLCFDANHLGAWAMRLAREGRYPEAVERLQRAVSLAPGEARLRAALAEVYDRMERAGDARAVLEAAVTECPNEPALRVALAQALTRDRDMNGAIAVLEAARQRWPGRAELDAALGAVLREAARESEAVPVLQEAIRVDPLQVEAHYELAMSLVATGRRAEARGQVETALQLRPDYPEAMLLRGSMAIEAGDVAAAERQVRRVYALRPDDSRARALMAALQLMKGKAAEAAGDLDEADRQYRAGIEAAPEFGPLLRESGVVAMRRGQTADAVEVLRRYVKVEPNDANGYTLLGTALYDSGGKAEAKRVWRRGLAVAQRAGDKAKIDEFETLLGRQ